MSTTGGTLTPEQFSTAATQFLSLSRRIGDCWELVESPVHGTNDYLRKSVKQKLLIGSRTIVAENTIDDEDELSQNDPSELKVAHDQSELVQFEYHVVYSVSYQVPMMYFNVYKSNGTQLRLEEAWTAFRELVSTEEHEQLKQTLTQMEHPVLFRPFLALHPCRTAQVLGNVNQSHNKIVSFLSSYGPFVDLKLDIRYADEEAG
ncbi:ubiquitin-like-conjugating enzyme ATG10 [Uranotaenia lowii]|uniref:ubiquitin-like-conjugating enzyme ATG10 n=1 Tax=Uranotaenia lowii TaxID=190385 RepID=UPI0024795847|nr:ubiquitin-like-conjugating enzyme ATG10 [Uranotaenia lowii]